MPALIFLVLMGLSAGCMHIPKTLPVEQSASILEKLDLDARQRQRVSGLFYARAQGIKQFFGGVELDLVAQAPKDLYVSPRTFFGSPAWVFTTNGFDASWIIYDQDLNNVVSTQGAVDHAMEQLLGMDLDPGELVDILLGKIDSSIGQVVDFKFNEGGEYYSMALKTPSREKISLLLRSTDGVLIEMKKDDERGELKFKVVYSDFRLKDSLSFAHKLTINTGVQFKKAELVLEARDIEVNGAPFSAEMFREIEPLESK